MRKTFCDICGREAPQSSDINNLTILDRGPGRQNGTRDRVELHLRSAQPVDGRHSPAHGDYCQECVMLQARQAINGVLGAINPNEAVVAAMAAHMVKRLNANNDKTGWKAGECERSFLVRRMLNNAERLSRGQASNVSMWDLAADVANYAMMLADRAATDYQAVVTPEAGTNDLARD